ncbi:hypothetical protein FRX31_017038 [Thalictrum thalictroides]|uniref:Transmembrane protein n=1 Tax=Thalictrum thalictroides TaxID=46969 RepID=A0A7J6WAH4_THATH|nr:hypothetical protein FRX31_017038 [Thalictrum thalictroides]
MVIEILFTFIIGLVVLFIIITGKSHRRPCYLDLIVPPYRPGSGSLFPSLVNIEIDVHGKQYMH